MERLTAGAVASSPQFVSWEEVNVPGEMGRRDREVRYYLKRRDGSSDLVVIGRERGARHMSYRYAIRDRFLLSISPSSSLLKLRSRREVVDWLNSIVSGTFHRLDQAMPLGEFACKLDGEALKDNELRKIGHPKAEFAWLGDSWTCRKRRTHYPSFLRNGVKISVNDFVFVLAEENKRLVAFVDDMYVDSRGNKMVVVRWFHKIDEVGIILPHNYNDREIFFSLCLQDLNVECIDGLATVLAPQHYEKVLAQARHRQLEPPFVCQSLFDNDEVLPFDITQLKGYKKQALLRYSNCAVVDSLKTHVNSLPSEAGVSDLVEGRLKKRLRRSKEDDRCINASLVEKNIETDVRKNYSGSCASLREDSLQKPREFLAVGSRVEVLSHDSGLRGCWFRAVVIKKRKNKVKVRYQDIKDADNEANSLAEWLLVSKVADPDPLELRMAGRTTIRPIPKLKKDHVLLFLCSGTVVDVWWHDGWWEAIVLQKENEDKIRVYMPGERKFSTFTCRELRLSKEWVGNQWVNVKERPDLVTSILSDLAEKDVPVDFRDPLPDKRTVDNGKDPVSNVLKEHNRQPIGAMPNKLKDMGIVRDLAQDALLGQLKWKSSKKRTPCIYSKSRTSPNDRGTRLFDSFFASSAPRLDQENCKFMGDSPFSSAAPALTSLVMSSSVIVLLSYHLVVVMYGMSTTDRSGLSNLTITRVAGFALTVLKG